MHIAPPRLHAAFALACSPRRGGNTDAAAQAFCQGFTVEGGRIDPLCLRDQRILPCVACDACSRFAPAYVARQEEAGPAVLAGHAARICPLAAQDDSTELFARLYTAQALFIASPIYFCHLPAQLKGFIDRGQTFWMLRSHQEPAITSLPERPAWMALTAGQPRGERMFEGALLTLRHFCELFNFKLQKPLLLPGFDGLTDLARTPPALEHVRRFGAQAAQKTRSASKP